MRSQRCRSDDLDRVPNIGEPIFLSLGTSRISRTSVLRHAREFSAPVISMARWLRDFCSSCATQCWQDAARATRASIVSQLTAEATLGEGENDIVICHVSRDHLSTYLLVWMWSQVQMWQVMWT